MQPLTMCADRISGRIKKATRNVATAGFVAAAAVTGTAASADWCHDEVTAAANKTEVAQILAALRAAGQQGTPLYISLETQFENKKHKAKDQCRSELSRPQDVTNTLVAIGTGGLSLIAPGKMLHVDVGEVLDGNIFGGPNSFFRKPFG